MGHTGIHAFGDCVRRTGLGRFATVVELRIPWIYPGGVSKSSNNLIIVLFIPVWWNWQTQGTFDLTNDKTGALLWKHSKWRWLKR